MTQLRQRRWGNKTGRTRGPSLCVQAGYSCSPDRAPWNVLLQNSPSTAMLCKCPNAVTVSTHKLVNSDLTSCLFSGQWDPALPCAPAFAGRSRQEALPLRCALGPRAVPCPRLPWALAGPLSVPTSTSSTLCFTCSLLTVVTSGGPLLQEAGGVLGKYSGTVLNEKLHKCHLEHKRAKQGLFHRADMNPMQTTSHI